MPDSELWRFDALGTRWQISLDTSVPADLRHAVERRLDEFDRTWSRFRSDSLVHQMSQAAGSWSLPSEADRLFSLYDQLSALTDGAVNPLVGDTISDLGYDAGYRLTPAPVIRSPRPWSTVTWAAPVLTTPRPIGLDIGAAGKGLAVDLTAELLLDAGVESFTIDASGDLLHHGERPLRVALEHPHDPSMAVGVVELSAGQAVCASAVTRRTWGEGLHHVVDARTAQCVDGVVATWVVADSAMLADGAATAAFFVPPHDLDGALMVRSLRVVADGHVQGTSRWPGDVFV